MKLIILILTFEVFATTLLNFSFSFFFFLFKLSLFFLIIFAYFGE